MKEIQHRDDHQLRDRDDVTCDKDHEPVYLQDIQIGFKDDGTVVWRERK